MVGHAIPPPPPPHIRLGQLEDMEDLLPLLATLFAIEADFHFDADTQRRGLALLLAKTEAVVAVAEVAGRVVAMATGQLLISTAEGAPSLLVEDVVVRDQWRRQDLGRRLLSFLREWGLARGATRMQLLADRENQAGLAFYRRLGWQSSQLVCLRQDISPGD